MRAERNGCYNLTVDCPTPRLIELRDRVTGDRYGKAVPCMRWRKCEACRELRKRRIWWKLLTVKDKIESLPESARRYKCVLITFTLDGSTGERYGVEGRKRIAKGMNRWRSALVRMCKRQRRSILAVVRTWEFMKDGAWHCHVALVYDRYIHFEVARLTESYAEGFCYYSFGSYKDRSGARQTATSQAAAAEDQGIEQAFAYCAKYCTKGIDEGFNDCTRIPNGTRFYSISTHDWLKVLTRAAFARSTPAQVFGWVMDWKSRRPVYGLYSRYQLVKAKITTSRRDLWNILKSYYRLSAYWLASLEELEGLFIQPREQGGTPLKCLHRKHLISSPKWLVSFNS